MRPIVTDFPRSVCVSVCGAKTAEPIEISFAVWTQAGPRNHLLSNLGEDAQPLRCGPFAKILWPLVKRFNIEATHSSTTVHSVTALFPIRQSREWLGKIIQSVQSAVTIPSLRPDPAIMTWTPRFPAYSPANRMYTVRK